MSTSRAATSHVLGLTADGQAGRASSPAGGAADKGIVAKANGFTDVFGTTLEHFLPLTRTALIDRLSASELWPGQPVREVRRFFTYLNFWRQNSYTARLTRLEQVYEPFNPDSDLLVTRKYTPEERAEMQGQLVEQVEAILKGANYRSMDPSQISMLLNHESHYGLDLEVDTTAFERLIICYRGATTRRAERRNKKRLFLTKEEFDVPIFRRLFILFKLKPFAVRAAEIAKQRSIPLKDAEKWVRKARASLPVEISDELVYMKLFKNIPRTDIEMVFPNTRIKFRMMDKVKFGVTAGGGLATGVIGTATKVAAATTPIGMAGAVVALGGVAARQANKFFNQRNKYMVTMAQNLYFHSLADNRGVLTLLADRAAEEDVKEEFLLYSVLAKMPAHVSEVHDVDHAIERWLKAQFGIDVDFDVHNALERLMADGVVSEGSDGVLRALPPAEAAERIDHLWDSYLDHLPGVHSQGTELDIDCAVPNGDATGCEIEEA